MPSDGGDAIQVTENGGGRSLETPDGKALFYRNRRDDGLWKLDLETGRETKVVTGEVRGVFGLGGNSLYYGVEETKDSLRRISVRRLDTGVEFDLMHFPVGSPRFPGGTSLAVSADEQTVLFAQWDRSESDLIMVEGLE